MPDIELEAPEREHAARDRSPIHLEAGPHEYVESEFPEGKGRCDRCGGGPDAAIHQKPVDQMERIADALERIAFLMTQILNEARGEGDREL